MQFAGNHRCMESIEPGLPFSRSPEGRLINPRPDGGGRAGRFLGSAWPQADGPSLRFKCASHFHAAEHAQAAPL